MTAAFRGLAAAPQPELGPDSVSNPVMIIMILLMVVLALVIVVLNYSIGTVIQLNREKDRKNFGGGKAVLTLAILLMSGAAFAQQPAATEIVTEKPTEWLWFGMTSLTFFGMLSVIVFELIIIIAQVLILRGMINYYLPPQPYVEKVKNPSEFWKKFHRAVDIEKEETILFDHEYDGIRELDNNLPPWWKYGFYVSILFAFAYMIHYHIAKSGPLQLEEYNTEVAIGKREVAEYLKNAADNVDENTVKYLDGKDDLSAGKGIYDMNCIACHGALGEGKVGPNLTDEYWIHGGSISDVFISVKYGWPDKGMKSWKDDLTPKQVAQVTSYIRSLQGSNPPNALPPKGDKYSEEKK